MASVLDSIAGSLSAAAQQAVSAALGGAKAVGSLVGEGAKLGKEAADAGAYISNAITGNLKDMAVAKVGEAVQSVQQRVEEAYCWLESQLTGQPMRKPVLPCKNDCPEATFWPPCDPAAKGERRRQRQALIAAGKTSSDPLRKEAAEALEREMEAVEQARLASDTYPYHDDDVWKRCGKPPAPCGFKRLDDSPETMKELGFWDGNPATLEQAKADIRHNPHLYDGDFAAVVYVEDPAVFGRKPPKVITAFRGTHTKGDIVVDFKNAIGKQTDSYSKAQLLAKKIALKRPDVEFSGHSLGGGLAETAAIAVDRPCQVFNSAGPHEAIVGADGRQRGESLIDRYNSPYDPLTTIQENRALQGVAVGIVGGVAGAQAVMERVDPGMVQAMREKLGIVGTEVFPQLGEALTAALGRGVTQGGYMIPPAVGRRFVVEPLDENGRPVPSHNLGGQHSVDYLVLGMEKTKRDAERCLRGA